MNQKSICISPTLVGTVICKKKKPDEFKVVKNRILSQIINDKVMIKFRVLKKTTT